MVSDGQFDLADVPALVRAIVDEGGSVSCLFREAAPAKNCD